MGANNGKLYGSEGELSFWNILDALYLNSAQGRKKKKKMVFVRLVPAVVKCPEFKAKVVLFLSSRLFP